MSVLFFKMFLDLFILLHVCECFTFILVCRKRLYLVATEIRRRPRYPGSSLTRGCEPLSGCWEPALCNCWASLLFPTHLLLMPSLFTTWWLCLSLFLYLNFLAWCLKGLSYSSLTAIFASVLWAVFLCLHTLCTFIKSSIWITAFDGVSCFAGRKSGCAWCLHSSGHQKPIFSLGFLFLERLLMKLCLGFAVSSLVIF